MSVIKFLHNGGDGLYREGSTLGILPSKSIVSMIAVICVLSFYRFLDRWIERMNFAPRATVRIRRSNENSRQCKENHSDSRQYHTIPTAANGSNCVDFVKTVQPFASIVHDSR